MPEFYGSKKGLLEVSKEGQKSNLVNKLFEKVKKYQLEHIVMIRHCPVLPKPFFSYYEKNTPLTVDKLDIISKNNSKDFLLKTMVVEAKNKKKRGSPDFTKPDFTITGIQMWELYNDFYYCHNNTINHYSGLSTNVGSSLKDDVLESIWGL